MHLLGSVATSTTVRAPPLLELSSVTYVAGTDDMWGESEFGCRGQTELVLPHTHAAPSSPGGIACDASQPGSQQPLSGPLEVLVKHSEALPESLAPRSRFDPVGEVHAFHTDCGNALAASAVRSVPHRRRRARVAMGGSVTKCPLLSAHAQLHL